MIPKITQEGPNIVPQYWCVQCSRRLLRNDDPFQGQGYNYCPGCGELIEWEKAVPVKWEPMSCDTCGQPMIAERGGHMVSMGNYVGTTTCRTCMEEHCAVTNCLACERGTYPNCRWKHLKRRPLMDAEGQV